MSTDMSSSGCSPKLSIAFIAGTGRCGSTLLELVLGAHSKIAAAGEIHIWPHEILQGGVLPSGCGRIIPECPFWNEMRHRSTAIVLDEGWRRSLPRSCQVITWLVSTPGRSRFGY